MCVLWTQNLGTVSMQLCALVSSKSCSSAWTLAVQQVDDNEEFVNGFKGQQIGNVAVEGAIFLLFMST